MALKIAINGATGRMGQRIAALCAEAGHEVVAPVDVNHVGEVLGEVTGDRRQKARIVDAYGGGADVLIDFSLPPGFESALKSALEHSTPFVSGTTGIEQKHRDQLAESAASIPVLWAPNMSVGVNLLFALAKQAASVLPESYDIEITEMHHRRKVDAPSGTALGLLNAVCDGNGRDADKVVKHGREGHTGERSSTEIGMHTLRGGDVVGDHTVMFATDGERIELTHKASNRDTFASGAVRAGEWITGKEPGRYTMSEVLNLPS